MRRAFFPETEYDLAAILRVNQKNADYLNVLMVSVVATEQVFRIIHQKKTVKLLMVNRNLHAALASYRI